MRRCGLLRALAPAAALLAGAAAPGLARADADTHYQDTVIGERAAGMGGAFTALASEATGAYYNPAGIVVDGATLIQASMSAYRWRVKRVEVLDLCGARVSEDEGGLFGFPATLGFARPFDAGGVRHAVGVYLVMPYATKASFAYAPGSARCGATTLDISGSRLLFDRTFVGGAVYAVRPLRWLRLGATLGVAVRSATQADVLLALATRTGVRGSGPAVVVQYAEVAIWSLFAQVGAIVEPVAGLRIGLAFTTPYLRLAGSGQLDIFQRVTGDATAPLVDLSYDDARYFWKVPFSLALGVAYERPGRFAVSADVKVHGPVGRYALYEAPGLPAVEGTDNERRLVVNVNVGGELYVTPRVALRAGFLTNFSSYPDVVPGRTDDDDHIDLYGVTLGGAFRMGEASIISAALQGQLGFGQTSKVIYRAPRDPANVADAETVVADARDLSLMLVFGGAVDLD